VGYSILRILQWRAPCEVGQFAIFSDTIKMSCYMASRARTDKRLKNQLMDLSKLALPITAKTYALVAVHDNPFSWPALVCDLDDFASDLERRNAV